MITVLLLSSTLTFWQGAVCNVIIFAAFDVWNKARSPLTVWWTQVFFYYFRYMWGKIPWADWAQIFFERRYPGLNHVFQIWLRSIQGFSVGCRSNFAIPHWLWRSSLQNSHYRVSVWYKCAFVCHRDCGSELAALVTAVRLFQAWAAATGKSGPVTDGRASRRPHSVGNSS